MAQSPKSPRMCVRLIGALRSRKVSKAADSLEIYMWTMLVYGKFHLPIKSNEGDSRCYQHLWLLLSACLQFLIKWHHTYHKYNLAKWSIGDIRTLLCIYPSTISPHARGSAESVGLVAGSPTQKAGGRMLQPAGFSGQAGLCWWSPATLWPAGQGRTGLTERSEVRYG